MKQKFFEVKCGSCQRNFEIKRKLYLNKLRRNKNCSFICSKECMQRFNKTGTLHKCLNCNNQIYVIKSKINSNNFCSKKCAAHFNNLSRIDKETTKGKKKILTCTICNGEYLGSIHTAYNKQHCKICLENKKIKKSILTTSKDKECILCNKKIFGSKKYCNQCRSLKLSLDRIAAIKNGKTNFKSTKCNYNFNGQIIKCDSKLEFTCLNWFEKYFSPLVMERSEVIIPYSFGGKNKNFNPDFKIITHDSIYIVECKGIVYSDSLNKKWHFYNQSSILKKEALENYCKLNNYKSFWFTVDLHDKFYRSIKF